jgi:pyochelin synthetase
MTPVVPVDARVYDVLAQAGFVDEPFNPRQHESCELMDRYVDAAAVRLLDGLRLRDSLAAPRSPDELLASCGFVAGFRPALAWLLKRLAQVGVLASEGDRFVLGSVPSPADGDALRAAVLASDPSYGPALALVDTAEGAYPAVARGETSGEHALFRKLGLWTSYFSNANRYYALNNRVAAHAAAARVPPGGRVLEVGAGLGSATEALLERLDDSLASYVCTEPVVFFRRRAERELRARRPDVAWTFASLDLNQPWSAQGVAPGAVDLVWGVNVFHLARDLSAALAEARAALAPGGWLIVGEGVRPTPDTAVAAEFPFLLLESFTTVDLDPASRPTPGFLTAEHWQRAFVAAGFTDVTLVPDAIALRRIHPAFYATAVAGRRP